jgi:hypothetical protein
MQSVRESAKGIDDIFTEVATLPSSTAPQSVVAWWPELSDGTVVPDDFILLAASGYEYRTLRQPKEPRSASEESDPSGPMLDSAKRFNARYIKFFLISSQSLMHTSFDMEWAKQNACPILAKAK